MKTAKPDILTDRPELKFDPGTGYLFAYDCSMTFAEVRGVGYLIGRHQQLTLDVATRIMDRNGQRLTDCYNACRPLEDPVKLIPEMIETLKAAYTTLGDEPHEDHPNCDKSSCLACQINSILERCGALSGSSQSKDTSGHD